MGFGAATQVLGLAVSCKSDPPQTLPVTVPAKAAPSRTQPCSKVTSPSPALRSMGPDPCSWHTRELYGTHRSLLPIASDS